MKIIKVGFENINSLAGRWEIDFTSPEYQDGIFLICGETGSGKTTILDAISLALYARTVREQISKNSNEVMTRGTGIARAEVEFECPQGRFCAMWEQRRAYGRSQGALQNVSIMLKDCKSGDFITAGAGTMSDVKEKIKSLVGLSFEQFQRTMMLAQGKFDQFLAADESDRAEILQQAAGTQIYEKIGRRIFERRRQAEAEVAALVTRIGEIRTLDDETLAAKKSELRQSAEKSREIAKTIDAAEKKLSAIVKAQSDLAEAEKALRHREKEFAACAANAEKSALALEAAATGLAAAENTCKENEPRIKSAIALTGRIALAQKDAAAKRALLDRLVAAGKDERAVESRENDKMAHAKAVFAIVCDAFDKLEFAKPNDARIARDACVKLAASFVKLAAENKNDERNAQKLREEVEKQTSLCAAEEAEWKKMHPILETNRENAQRAYETFLAYASLDEWRMRLEDGKACPLCGSQHHPYAEHVNAPEKSACESALAAAKDALAKLDSRRDAAREKRDHALSALDAYAKERDALRRKFEDSRSCMVEARTSTASSISASEEALAKTRERIAKIDADCAAATAECEKFTCAVNELQSEYDALGIGAKPEKTLAKLQAALDAAKEKHAAAKASDAAAKANLTAARKELESAVKRCATCQDAVIAATRQTEGTLEREALCATIAGLKNEKAAADAKSGALEAELNHDAGERVRLAAYSDNLAAAKEKAMRWANLDKWLGGARGEQFKRFAHGITLRRLLTFANPHLERMTAGRYRMEWNSAGSQGCEKLLPSLVDNEQGGVKRPVSNLSGGERFQVSLALALGLSEMSSARLDVDSLFLDEGFGTLDDNTLEAALDTLCAVQQDGKLIGVISHVAGVAERLTTQIRVAKTGNGRSVLSGPGVAAT